MAVELPVESGRQDDDAPDVPVPDDTPGVDEPAPLDDVPGAAAALGNRAQPAVLMTSRAIRTAARRDLITSACHRLERASCARTMVLPMCTSPVDSAVKTLGRSEFPWYSASCIWRIVSVS